MSIQQYSVNQHPIQTLLTWIKSGEIAIPEIQRPFVWSATKVRDLIDSLYEGYPTTTGNSPYDGITCQAENHHDSLKRSAKQIKQGREGRKKASPKHGKPIS